MGAQYDSDRVARMIEALRLMVSDERIPNAWRGSLTSAADQLEAARAEIDRQTAAVQQGAVAIIWFHERRAADCEEAATTYESALDLVEHLGGQLDAERIKVVEQQDRIAELEQQAAELTARLAASREHVAMLGGGGAT